MLMVAGLLGMFFLSALYLRQVLGFGPVETGVAFLPVAVAIGILSLGFAERLNTRFGPRTVLVPGLLLMGIGLALLTRAPAHAVYLVDLLPVMLLLGIGAGLSFPALMTLAMSGATSRESGLASGMVNTTQQVGGALGLSALATLSASRTAGLLHSGTGGLSALIGGYQLAFGIGAGLLAIAVVLAAAVLRSRSTAERAEVAEHEEEQEREPAA
jgi:MFS family permease